MLITPTSCAASDRRTSAHCRAPQGQMAIRARSPLPAHAEDRVHDVARRSATPCMASLMDGDLLRAISATLQSLAVYVTAAYRAAASPTTGRRPHDTRSRSRRGTTATTPGLDTSSSPAAIRSTDCATHLTSLVVGQRQRTRTAGTLRKADLRHTEEVGAQGHRYAERGHGLVTPARLH